MIRKILRAVFHHRNKMKYFTTSNIVLNTITLKLTQIFTQLSIIQHFKQMKKFIVRFISLFFKMLTDMFTFFVFL